MFKGYLHKSAANKNKKELAQTVLVPFRNALKEHYAYLVFTQQSGAQIPKRTPLKQCDFNTNISARQIQTLYTQALAIFDSQQVALTNNIKKYIYASSLTDFEKHVLYRINKYQLWYKSEVIWKAWVTDDGKINLNKKGKVINYAVPEYLLFLSRKLIKKAHKNINKPNLNYIQTFMLDSKVIDIEDSKQAKHFKYFAKLSLLPGNKKPVRLPLYNNSYYLSELHKGERRKSLQLSFRENEVFVTTVLEIPDVPLRPENKIIGLDWGMKSIFTDSNGRMFGKKAMRKLVGLDAQMIKIQKNCQANNIKLSASVEYNKINKKIRNLMKNEIGRILNKLTTDEISELVVEDLDFQFGGLSRRLNRILKRSGRAIVANKLLRLTEEKGVKITKVNPAYTSQMCSHCGFVNKKNRKDQSHFKCLFCGFTQNADVNAARNILQRRSLNISLFQKHTVLKKQLDKLHQLKYSNLTNLRPIET